ncbi:hypothetical protein H9Y04_18280 [Streptomyces sp. TRM66268-LWL]|uniref:Uncharacterized protein n=1 Tax=Streptomyces polyasparticus TaxID=2767826 RepID=A0ABR7SHU8_9ACTN|nr:hypothetical protein [Streptomyces polyasparticus]MBC9714509.1 hypothetical protein [Streptomyces polyasparticus]
MELARLYGAAEIVVPLLVFVAFSLRRWKSGMRDAWRQEAEAWALKAQRQADEIVELRHEVRELRRENAELRAQVAELLARP